ncbi:MAG TPA: hypothetical protein VFS19_01415 [Planctomycetota bacterium]|nr:hypothetical protein [Planctomycetota bacterium]
MAFPVGGTMESLMVAILLALTLVQDPGEEIRTLLRRLEGTANTPAESAEIVLRLGQAVEQIAPGQARTLLGDAMRADRLPTARRLDVAETLLGLEDRTWAEDAERIALDAAEPADTRVRAALLLARAGSARADDVGRSLDQRLFSEGTEEAARALGAHLREGTSLEQQRFEIDLLFKLPIPGARAALREAMADDGLVPALRLEIAERLHAARALDRGRDARAALERVRSQEPSLAARVNRLLAALREIREDPAAAVGPEPGGSSRRVTRASDGGSSARTVNLAIAGGTAAILAILLATRRRT